MNDILIPKEGMRRLLEGLKVHKASDPDGISPFFIKELSEPVSAILARILNKSSRVKAA